MGRFNDLPKDVVWLIFRRVIEFFRGESPSYYDSGKPFDFYSFTGVRVSNLAKLSKLSLRVFKSKTYRVGPGFLFIQNSFSD